MLMENAGLLATATGDHLLLWHENLAERTSLRWRRHVVDDQTRRPVHGKPIDLDRDGGMDGIACGYGAEQAKVSWVEIGAMPTPKSVPHTHKSPWSKASSGLTGKLNQDGIRDIAGSAERGSNELCR